MWLLQSSLAMSLLLCLGCTAQSASSDVDRRIERQVRAYFKLPATVKVKVGERKPSEFPDFETVAITLSDESRSNSVDFLISKDNNTLYRMTKLDISKDPFAETMKKIDTRGRPVRGAKDAKVEIVIYDDIQCPYCARLHRTLFKDLMNTYGDRVRVIYKDYPIPQIHPWAVRGSIGANCLAEQSHDAYWDFSDYAHLNQHEITGEKRPVPEQMATLDQKVMEYGARHSVDAARLKACLDKGDDAAVRASIEEGDALGVNSTPTLFINGERVDGAIPGDELRAVLNRSLLDAGQQAPAAVAKESPPASGPSSEKVAPSN